MNPQEILANLSSLEKELQNIKSARILAEETIGSYQETKKEIIKLVDGLKYADDSLIAIVEAFKAQNVSLSDTLKQGIDKTDNQLTIINKAFQDGCGKLHMDFAKSIATAVDAFKSENVALSETLKQKVDQVDAQLSDIHKKFEEECNKSNIEFSETIETAIGELRLKTADLLNDYAINNTELKKHVDWLSSLGASITATSSSTNVINDKVTVFQTKFDEYCKKQELILGEINQKLINNIASHEQSLSQISDKLSSMQDKYDVSLQNMSDKLQKIESDCGILQKTLKNIQIYVIISIILISISLAYPFIKEFIKI